MAETKDALAEKRELLRKPFSQDEIEKLPRYTGQKVNGKIPANAYGYCKKCGKRHALPAIHLDYVGHAGITDRLNDVDPEWNWEPLAFDSYGLPMYDSNGGLWIKLTVLGVTRFGYGDAQGKVGANAVKEIIGDAIRNAAMRFGVATYLWSKSDKADHLREYTEAEEAAESQSKPQNQSNGANTQQQQKTPATALQQGAAARKETFAHIAKLKMQAMENGVKEEGINSWFEAKFGKVGMNRLTNAQLKEVTEYLETIVRDSADRHLLKANGEQGAEQDASKTEANGGAK